MDRKRGTKSRDRSTDQREPGSSEKPTSRGYERVMKRSSSPTGQESSVLVDNRPTADREREKFARGIRGIVRTQTLENMDERLDTSTSAGRQAQSIAMVEKALAIQRARRQTELREGGSEEWLTSQRKLLIYVWLPF